MKKIREYIYIDTTELNSILAQCDEGLNTLTRRVEQHKEDVGNGTQETTTDKEGIAGGIPGIVQGQATINNASGLSTQNTISDMSQDAVETVYNDFGVELLEQNLSDGIKKYETAEIGGFVKLTGKFDIYDFESLKLGLDPEKVEKIMTASTSDDEELVRQLKKKIKTIKAANRNRRLSSEQEDMLNDAEMQLQQFEDKKKSDKYAMQNIRTMAQLADYGLSALPNTILVTTPEAVVYAKNNNFRMNSAQLQMLQNSDREVTIIGIVENKLHDIEGIKNGALLQELSERDLGKLSTMMTNVMLSNFNILKEDNLQIKPISIYLA